MLPILELTMPYRITDSDLADLPWPQHAQRFQQYAQHFASCFRRRDQVRWLTAYLSGLLWGEQRKTAGALARSLNQTQDERAAFNIAQALQNFVNQSPWDEQR